MASPRLQDGGGYCNGIAPTLEGPVSDANPAEIYKWLIGCLKAGGYASRNSGDLCCAFTVTEIMRDDGAPKIRREALSPTLSLPDIIDLEVFSIGPRQTSFALLSQSLLGTEDFGLNGRRRERILEDFTDIHFDN